MPGLNCIPERTGGLLGLPPLAFPETNKQTLKPQPTTTLNSFEFVLVMHWASCAAPAPHCAQHWRLAFTSS